MNELKHILLFLFGLTFLISCGLSSNQAKKSETFGKLDIDYDKVIAYDYEGRDGKGAMSIVTNGKLAQTVKQQKQLSQEQTDNLMIFLNSQSTYGGSKAFCFEPHLGIVFYKKNTVVAHISICLECNYLVSSIKIPAKEAVSDDEETLLDGFSPLGRQRINSICKQLNFSHCADTLNSIVDD